MNEKIKSKTERQENILERQHITVLDLISRCASIISIDISMDIHIHGKPGYFSDSENRKW